MKIRIKTKDASISVDSFNGSIQEIVDLYKEISSNPIAIYEKQHVTELQTGKKQYEAPVITEEKSPIRDRLPNNVVDIKDLDVQKAMTENVLVRCPHCGQAYAIIVKDGIKLFLMRRDFDANEFVIIAEAEESELPLLIAKNGEAKKYYDNIHNKKVINSSDFAVNDDTEIFCPLCHESNDFYKWKDAFRNPWKFFEYEKICDICGGELSPVIDSKNSNSMICDKCGKIWEEKEWRNH